jgi:polar amino acid transport system substrate-binding protein
MVKTRIACVLLMSYLSLVSGQVFARDLKIIFSQYTPPYVFENDTGIVVDIVRAALQSEGYTVKPVYVPIGRAFKMFADKQADGTTIIQESSGLKAFYSDDFMNYYNRVFALKSRNLAIHGVADLHNMSVIAYQNADKYMGKEFGRVVAGSPKYKEMAQQDAQTQMLFLGRTDVVVMDEGIFRYYHEKLMNEGKVAKSQEFESFEIFPPTPYKAAFNDAKLRDDFNKGIAAMRKDGRYDAIYRKYVSQYFEIRK